MEDSAAVSAAQPLVQRDTQRCDPLFSPPRWLVPAMTRVHVWLYRASRGRIGPDAGGMRHVLLRTRGRRSGRPATACLPTWLDEEGHRILVASYAGAPHHPAWYHNATDHGANPTVRVQDGRRTFLAVARELPPDERDRLWRALVDDRPFYARYQELTRRRIPLVRLVEEGPVR